MTTGPSTAEVARFRPDGNAKFMQGVYGLDRSGSIRFEGGDLMSPLYAQAVAVLTDMVCLWLRGTAGFSDRRLHSTADSTGRCNKLAESFSGRFAVQGHPWTLV